MDDVDKLRMELYRTQRALAVASRALSEYQIADLDQQILALQQQMEKGAPECLAPEPPVSP
jgi:hypothetical protein